MVESLFKQFDQVRVLTTRNVSYLSDLPGTVPEPHGTWLVAGIVDNDLLLSKKSCLIRIPTSDVVKIVDYSTDTIYSVLDNLRNSLNLGTHNGQRKEDI